MTCWTVQQGPVLLACGESHALAVTKIHKIDLHESQEFWGTKGLLNDLYATRYCLLLGMEATRADEQADHQVYLAVVFIDPFRSDLSATVCCAHVSTAQNFMKLPFSDHLLLDCENRTIGIYPVLTLDCWQLPLRHVKPCFLGGLDSQLFFLLVL